MGGVSQRVEAQLESEVAAADTQIAQLERQLSELQAEREDLVALTADARRSGRQPDT